MNSNIEGIELFQEPETSPTENETSFENMRDQVFDSILLENIVSAYERDLQETGFSPEEIQVFFSTLNNTNEDDQKKILAFAFEQRRLLFKNFLEQIHQNKITIKEFVQELLSMASEYEYDIGFHVTNHQIKQTENKERRQTWEIKGLEKDHRDNDLPMAFYSKQYRHLYGKKGYHYVYIVRSLPDHRTDGNWFRAPSLSIISELKTEPDKLVDRIQLELEKRKKAPRD